MPTFRRSRRVEVRIEEVPHSWAESLGNATVDGASVPGGCDLE